MMLFIGYSDYRNIPDVIFNFLDAADKFIGNDDPLAFGIVYLKRKLAPLERGSMGTIIAPMDSAAERL